MTKKPDFFACDTDSWKLKVDRKILGWAWSENGYGHSGLTTLKLAVSQEGISEINWFGVSIKIQKSQKLL